ncbi:uncharacterized protein LOC126326580 [Schistocerca gregaria]|uniref:uncharacterized protein LOC126326580 n=1 Tax=Schistocerca gregaria TaxID=7010 RepID=UPI00211E23DB|nr:uncharacterized protein LOC126326580 [Schistocerca gregaria]
MSANKSRYDSGGSRPERGRGTLSRDALHSDPVGAGEASQKAASKRSSDLGYYSSSGSNVERREGEHESRQGKAGDSARRRGQAHGEDRPTRKDSGKDGATLLLEGVIYKYKGTFRGWKKRNFRLCSDGVLKYYRRAKERGRINILTSVVALSRSNSRRFEVDTGNSVFHLKTLNSEDRSAWIEKIKFVQAANAMRQNVIKSQKMSDDIEGHLAVVDSKISVLNAAYMLFCKKFDELKQKGLAGEVAPQDRSEGATKVAKSLRDVEVVRDSVGQIIYICEDLSKQLRDLYSCQKEMREMEKQEKLAAGALKMRPLSETELEETIENTGLVIEGAESDSEDYFDAEFEDDNIIESSADSCDMSSEEYESNFEGGMQPVSKPSRGMYVSGDTLCRRMSRLHQFGSSMKLTSVTKVSLEETLSSVPADFVPRRSLPSCSVRVSGMALVKILRDSIGKDLSRITIPVQFSEPINMMQRLVEDFEYAEILNEMAKERDSMRRLVMMCGFAASGYASTLGRLGKPFNPLLGETYELVNACKGKCFRSVSEQVSHHPPVSACVAEGQEWTVQGYMLIKNKFWGKSIEIYPTGGMTCRVPKYGDMFSWNKVITCVNNVLIGSKWIDSYGEMTIVNDTTQEKCLLDFKRRKWWGAGAYEVSGEAYNKENKLRYQIEGHWNEEMKAYPVEEDGTRGPGFTVWKRHPPLEDAEKQYQFTEFTMQLNELPDWLRPLLPRTDTRLRTDQMAMENGEFDLAASEKSRLEVEQRNRMKEISEEDWVPNWFEKDQNGKWTYKGGYWEARKERKWPPTLPELF